MKKIIIGFSIGLLVSLFFAFTNANYQVNSSTAEVTSYEGIKVFIESKPIKEYEYLGTVKRSSGARYGTMRDKLIKKAKKKYPECDAVILNLQNYGPNKADVIKFKKPQN